MPRSPEQVAVDLDGLRATDFDYANTDARGWDRLHELCDEMRTIDNPEACAPIMFGMMERLADTDLGTPGPLVHTLEKWQGRYESSLKESIGRKPTSLTVWMVNRILNARPADYEDWLALLEYAAFHPEASEEARMEAQRFIKHQTGE